MDWGVFRRILPTKRRSVSPMAIGWAEPSGFFRGNSVLAVHAGVELVLSSTQGRLLGCVKDSLGEGP